MTDVHPVTESRKLCRSYATRVIAEWDFSIRCGRTSRRSRHAMTHTRGLPADITAEDSARSIRIESKLGQTADTFLRDITCTRETRNSPEFARTKWVTVCT